MAGKFINTTYTNKVDTITSSIKDILNNPYYKWSDKPPTTVEYFNVNKEQSTVDEGSLHVYDQIGPDSPIKYNRIEDMLIYGLESMSISMNTEDFGVETSALEGEAVILPNTIIPNIGDRFIIKHTNNKTVFKVTNVEEDTLEFGSNMYKITFQSSSSDYDSIISHVCDNYKMLIDNVGTSLHPIIRSEVYDLISEIETMLVYIKKVYKNIFYNTRVQTLIFKYLEVYFYDAYMIEFIKNNRLLEGDDQYVYIGHQLPLPELFPVKYTETLFHALEQRKIMNGNFAYNAIGEFIDNLDCIFRFRMEDYYQINYDRLYKTQDIIPNIPCFDEDLIHHILHNKLYEGSNRYYNIIIKYMNYEDITIDDCKCVMDVLKENNVRLFYAVPCIIFCLEQIIYSQLQKK